MPPNRADLLEILRLRLLICRAAAADSLRWWDDNSLTEDGTFLLSRLFPRSTRTAARRLALEAASLRHAAAFAGLAEPQHLFDLGADVELALQDIPLDEPQVLDTPVLDIETLVVAIGGDEPRLHSQPEGAPLMLQMAPGSALREKALALAAAYAAGQSGQPVFPVIAPDKGAV
jgi:hypothetical protein